VIFLAGARRDQIEDPINLLRGFRVVSVSWLVDQDTETTRKPLSTFKVNIH